MLVQAYGARAGDNPLEPMQINRRTPAAHDVQIDIAFCGICHSDLHQVRAEWAGTQFPCEPGHEIVGRVSAVGAHVAGFKVGGLVGAPASPHPSPNVFNLIMKRRTIAGSMIAGIPQTQEMLDFCAEHSIVADIELVRADQINESYERMLKGDVKYRFVIDNATLVD
ncbi:Aldehyde reductase YahK [Pseudomonas sp. IT-196MI5]|uniref:alcohol dehydrogenase catalytic domain-containing protein n=1 Tax=unclassified Pseudomonas TaxID=196821 RepID=UPI0039DFFDBB